MYLKEKVLHDVGWIDMSQDKDQWRACDNAPAGPTTISCRNGVK